MAMRMPKYFWPIAALVALAAYMIYRGMALANGSVTGIFSKHVPPDANILFIGSSSTIADNNFADKLAMLYPEMTIAKVAMVGAQTGWMVDNATAQIQSGLYDAVVINGGLNDIYATLGIDGATENLQTLYDLSKNMGCITVAITVQPTFDYASYTEQKGALTVDLNSWIMNNPTPDFVVDQYSLLLNPDGSQNTSLYADDYLHLNDAGHALLADALNNTIM